MPCPSPPFHFVPFLPRTYTDRPTDQFFFHSNCAPIVWSPWGSQSVPSSLRSVSPSPLHHSARASATGSISIDLKFSKPISCTRLQLALEGEEEGERRREGERVKSSWCCRHRCGRGGETGLRKGCYGRQKGYLTRAAAAEKGGWSFPLSPALSILPSFTVHHTAGSQEESRRGSGRAGGRSVGRPRKKGARLSSRFSCALLGARARWDRQIEEEGRERGGEGERERDRESAKKERRPTNLGANRGPRALK